MTQAQMDLKALEDLSEDLCRLCGDGGHLLLCESCPAAFHLECMGMDKVRRVWRWPHGLLFESTAAIAHPKAHVFVVEPGFLTA